METSNEVALNGGSLAVIYVEMNFCAFVYVVLDEDDKRSRPDFLGKDGCLL